MRHNVYWVLVDTAEKVPGALPSDKPDATRAAIPAKPTVR